MIFNSIEFALFLPIVFILYWFVFGKNGQTQNHLLLFASTTFYCFASWKFIFLLFLLGFINYFAARFIFKQNSKTYRNLLFYSGITINILILGYFKYFNFFIESFIELLNYTGFSLSFTPFHILLPLGISYFTFQMIGYLIDTYNEVIEPTDDVIGFFTYLIYFPKILSGPIERVQTFLPQINKKREFDYEVTVDGLRQILWGLFKKMVIADNIAPVLNSIFNYQNSNGSAFILGGIIYIVYVYADFSGYSDMACGISKLFGIKIMNNFAFPFFSSTISEFWRKWHISLTSWLMDYVFTPLSFLLRRYNKFGLIISILVTFVLVGIWHGPNWTFVVFGIFHGLYFIPLILKGSINKNKALAGEKSDLTIVSIFRMAGIFILVAVTSILMRSENVGQAIAYYSLIFSKSTLAMPDFLGKRQALIMIIVIIIYLIGEWFGRDEEYAGAKIKHIRIRGLRWTLYIVILLCLYLFGNFYQKIEFIYYQF